MIKLLIVDDHAVIREGLKRILGLDPGFQVAGTAANAEEALRFVSTIAIDIIILDISMPGKSGLDITEELKALQPHAKIIMLSMHKEDQFALRAFKSGASGYITKEHVSEEIINAIYQVQSGKRYYYPGFEERLIEMNDNSMTEAPHHKLSRREYQVMCQIASGIPLKKIAAELSVSDRTVSTYRARIIAKLRVRSNAEIIKYVLEMDLLK